KTRQISCSVEGGIGPAAVFGSKITHVSCPSKRTPRKGSSGKVTRHERATPQLSPTTDRYPAISDPPGCISPCAYRPLSGVIPNAGRAHSFLRSLSGGAASSSRQLWQYRVSSNAKGGRWDSTVRIRRRGVCRREVQARTAGSAC